jgi:hypothetical protein
MQLLLPNTSLIFWTIFSMFLMVLFAVALFNFLNSTFKDGTTKLLWLLVILFVPIAGPIFYLTIGRKQRVKVAI